MQASEERELSPRGRAYTPTTTIASHTRSAVKIGWSATVQVARHELEVAKERLAAAEASEKAAERHAMEARAAVSALYF